MKKTIFCILVVSLFCPLAMAGADDEKIKIGPGMELLQIGTVRVIVPKGTKYEDKGSKVEVEGIGEYVGRRFLEMEERFAALEAKEEALKEEVARLKEEIEQLKTEEAPVQEEGQRLRE
ncbi:MAG: hypothetical protein JW869_03815 [Candidatus Omnitrophica bacterium]|nr:hypothetical protein [Candidatus Omnitrophota bacterium]